MKTGTRIPWLALGILIPASLLFLGSGSLQVLLGALPACPLKASLGLPCATCGLTRCVLALLEGHWAEAFHWHPVALMLGLASPVAVAWDLRRAWRGDPYPPLPESLPVRLGVAGSLVGTWLLQIVRGI